MTKHPKGIWFVSVLYFWEYFSFYGMRAIFVLYLINELQISDHRSYAIYGAFTGLAYLAPLVGGVIADKVMGFRNALILGGLLMCIGHFILGFDPKDLFYIALAFIICGFGYFESNIACLVNQLYSNNHPKRDSGFIILYVGANIGGPIGAILCGYITYFGTWEYAFSVAGIGMFTGVLIFISGLKHIPNIIPTDVRSYKQRFAKNILIALISFASILISIYIIQNGYETYLISSTTIIATLMLIIIMIKNRNLRSKIFFTIPFIVFAMLFWIFDDMSFTAIEVFIDRNVDLYIGKLYIPASVLICINPFTVMLLGIIIAFVWQKNKVSSNLKQMVRFSLGFIIQFISFICLSFAAYLATLTGKASIEWVVASIALLGAAELFINPIALSNITKAGGAKYAGFMAALYTLYTSSIAELSSARLAQLTSEQDIEKIHDLKTQAGLFMKLFGQVSLALLMIIIIWLTITLIIKVRSRKNFRIVSDTEL